MDNLTNSIYQEISAGGNVLLVGPTDSGKTWYVKNTLMPFLMAKNMRVVYFSNPDDIQESNNAADVCIIDEIETLFDHDFLTAHSHDSEPYYTDNYLAKVKIWHDKLGKLNTPSVYILTRNQPVVVNHIVNQLKVTDWGTKVKCLVFDIMNRQPISS